MPSAAVDPDRLLALAEALTPLREAARSGADEVLSHYSELGDRETQVVIDAYLDHAADALREIDAAASDLAGRLRIAAHSASDAERRIERSAAETDKPAPRGLFR